MPTASLELAILDFHGAFSQRSHWARVNVLVNDEVGKFEKRLVGDWTRMKAHLGATPTDSDEKLVAAGRRLYKWAELESGHIQIRTRVTEEYVRRGTFHILANETPVPRVHWHPKFLEQLNATQEVRK
jgi:hypothetical protein